MGEQDQVRCDTYGVRHYCGLLSSDKLDEGSGVTEVNDAESVAHGVGGAAIATGPDFGCVHFKAKP